MLLLIDNYDSFTWNLYQYFRELGMKVIVVRNDAITIAEIESLPLTHLVISPGPCSPNTSGISVNAIRHFSGLIPILGVCLGHQAIAYAYGAHIVRSRKVMHGKISTIFHSEKGVFRNLKNFLKVTRYHSLIVAHDTLPAEFEITAWSLNKQGNYDEIMGFRHRNIPLEGIQFHPESILTEQGYQLLANFIKT
ncbi:aminodeoxychorismate/anthranilate synthase component II [Pantoea sp. Aalb]|uniref:anthranilate synthase component II n=1 Tax=Pantoea sp. Aalb TaxID=2576762 RepID=UPI00132CB598|nr:aminodeoxychorismate/anthranilate synthase component II [Pantoea sp. Aalb]MXP67867.1 aminodeoxychorismate/anthranilate synthase component II [Pantoea sp. Aalb]